MNNKQRLIELIREKALTTGQFRLSSGVLSPYYVDLSKLVMSSEGLAVICWALSDQLEQDNWFYDDFDSVGGPAMGAIPLVSAFMYETGIERAFFVRSEPKVHGQLDLVEGNLQAGDRVLMLEDVTTSGKSLLKAIKTAEAHGGRVVQIYSVFDRESDAKELFERHDYKFTSLATASEVLVPN